MYILFNFILLFITKKKTETRTCSGVVIGDVPVSYWPIFSLSLVHCVTVQEVSVDVIIHLSFLFVSKVANKGEMLLM